jgi:hypothetical protein
LKKEGNVRGGIAEAMRDKHAKSAQIKDGRGKPLRKRKGLTKSPTKKAGKKGGKWQSGGRTERKDEWGWRE